MLAFPVLHPMISKSVSSDRAGLVDGRAFPPVTIAVKLVICVHAAHGLLEVCRRTGGCDLGGRKRAARARAEVNDERELETALLRGVEAVWEF